MGARNPPRRQTAEGLPHTQTQVVDMNVATLNLIKSALRLDRSMDPPERAHVIRLLTSQRPQDPPADKARQLDTYLSPRDAAAYLGFSKRTLARYVEAGRIKPCRLNARVLMFKRSALDALLGGEAAMDSSRSGS